MKRIPFYLLFFGILGFIKSEAQTNLVLNGDFEDINTCIEYKSECGVEGWFYLSEVKAQMLTHDKPDSIYGSNSYVLYLKYLGYEGFMPAIGTLLPCGLQKGNVYTFSGVISANIGHPLTLMPAIAMGQKYYVPRRPYVKDITPATISNMQPIPKSDFFRFNYSFTATGDEKYLTFGIFVKVDTTGAKRAFYGTQTISLVLDHFSLKSADPNEGPCPAFETNKDRIYKFDYRHRDMDYPLFGKGEISVNLVNDDSSYLTKPIPPPPIVYADTLKLGDVFFDFNKSTLKPTASKMLQDFFGAQSADFDSIRIEGHTDSIGTEEKNIQLSLDRSNAVRAWLVAKGNIVVEKLSVIPWGESKPISTNRTAAGRALNRRVEIIVFRHREQSL